MTNEKRYNFVIPLKCSDGCDEEAERDLLSRDCNFSDYRVLLKRYNLCCHLCGAPLNLRYDSEFDKDGGFLVSYPTMMKKWYDEYEMHKDHSDDKRYESFSECGIEDIVN